MNLVHRTVRMRHLTLKSGVSGPLLQTQRSRHDVTDTSASMCNNRVIINTWRGTLLTTHSSQIPVCPPTRRLALVDLDWSQLRAVDILAAMRSFCPSGGRVERVTVYPSDYGLQQMAAERESGPRAVLRASDALDNAEAGHKRQRWQRVAGKARSGAAVDDMLLASEEEEEEEDEHDDDDDEEEGVGESDEDVDAQVAAAMGGLSGSEDGMDSESGSGEDEEGPPVIGGAPGDDEPDTRTPEEKRVAARIRMYERSKLRWYYAIAECDTKATALRLYEECDGAWCGGWGVV